MSWEGREVNKKGQIEESVTMDHWSSILLKLLGEMFGYVGHISEASCCGQETWVFIHQPLSLLITWSHNLLALLVGPIRAELAPVARAFQ